MKNILMLAFIVFVMWKYYTDYWNIANSPELNAQTEQTAQTIKQKLKVTNQQPNFTCDGRQHCSQMTSCDEATYFIQNCPNTKMDGDNDGVPCERQWCN